MAEAIYTIGHSTRPIDAFIELLRRSAIEVVVDVRTVPRSRTNPQYNRDALPASLGEADIDYQHLPALGGLRGRDRETPFTKNAFWENDSFHNYADYAMSEPFREGLETLRNRGHTARSAVMCAETVWWRCHRRIITDYLLAAGERVLHILGPGHIEPATINEAAQLHANGTLTYPAEQRDLFDAPGAKR